MFVAWSQWVAIVRHKPSQDRTEPGRAVAIHPPATLRLVVMRRASTIHRTELARATLHAARVAWPGMVPGSGRGFQITTPWRGNHPRALFERLRHFPLRSAHERAGSARKRSLAEGVGCARGDRSGNKLLTRPFDPSLTLLRTRLAPLPRVCDGTRVDIRPLREGRWRACRLTSLSPNGHHAFGGPEGDLHDRQGRGGAAGRRKHGRTRHEVIRGG